MSQINYTAQLTGTAKNGKEYIEFVVGSMSVEIGDELMVVPPTKYNLPSRQIGIVDGLGQPYKREADGLTWQRAYFTRTGN